MTGLCCGSRPCVGYSLNQLIPPPECVCCSLCEPDRPTPVASEYSRLPPALVSPLSSLQLVPVTRIEKRSSSEEGEAAGIRDDQSKWWSKFSDDPTTTGQKLDGHETYSPHMDGDGSPEHGGFWN